MRVPASTIDHGVRFCMALTVAACTLPLAFSHGGYFPSSWGVVGVVAVAFVVVLVAVGECDAFARSWRGRIVAATLMGAFAWTLLGAADAANRQVAIEEAARTAVYGSLIVIGAVIQRGAGTLLAFLGVAVFASVAVASASLVGADGFGAGVVRDGRLIGVLGYHNALGLSAIASFWPMMGVAALRTVHWAVALAFGAAGAVLLQVAVMTQSRGALVVFAVSGLCVVSLARQRAMTALLATVPVACVIANWSMLNAIYAAAHSAGAADAPSLSRVGTSIGVWSLACAATTWVLVRVDRSDVTVHRRVARIAAPAVRWLGGAVAIVALAAILAGGGARAMWASFLSADNQSHSTRFTSASNNGRLELWRTAIATFRDHPVQGVGGGNWESEYYERRSHDAGFVRQPHNLSLELLAERGFVGFALVMAPLVGACAIGLSRLRRGALNDVDHAATLAAVAIVGAWMVAAQIDWFWQMTAVSWIPMLCAGALLGVRLRQRRTPIGFARSIGRIGGVAVVTCMAVTVALPALSWRYLQHANTAPREARAGMLERARTLFPVSADVAQAQARLAASDGDRAATLEYTRQAIALDRRHYGRYVVAGTLARSVGDDETAHMLDTAATRLNPLRAG